MNIEMLRKERIAEIMNDINDMDMRIDEIDSILEDMDKEMELIDDCSVEYDMLCCKYEEYEDVTGKLGVKIGHMENLIKEIANGDFDDDIINGKPIR
jgi:archaellum component FlaC